VVSLARVVIDSVRAYPLQNQRIELRSLIGGRAATGQYIDREQALRVSAVYACVNLISRTIGMLPLHVHERLPDGGRLLVKTPETAFLWDQPNPEAPSSIHWTVALGHGVLTGNTYLYVERAGGKPKYLWPIDPQRIQVGRTSVGDKVYLVDGTLEQKDFAAGGNIVHIPGWGTDGLKGLSPIALGANAIGLHASLEKSAAKISGTGGQPSGILATEQPIDTAQADAIADLFEEKHGGSENAGKVLVIGKGFKWTPTTINPDDLQSLESRRYQVVDIARDFLVPAEMISAAVEGSASLTYANLQDRTQHLLTFTLQPWITWFEQSISKFLLPANQYVKFNVDAILRGNTAERVAYYQGMAELEAITIDEIRQREDFGPIPAGAKMPKAQSSDAAAPGG